MKPVRLTSLARESSFSRLVFHVFTFFTFKRFSRLARFHVVKLVKAFEDNGGVQRSIAFPPF